MFNLIGFFHTLIVILLAYCVVGFTAGFFASVMTIGIIVGGLWLYSRYAQRKPRQRFYIASFGSAYYRMEVA